MDAASPQDLLFSAAMRLGSTWSHVMRDLRILDVVDEYDEVIRHFAQLLQVVATRVRPTLRGDFKLPTGARSEVASMMSLLAAVAAPPQRRSEYRAAPPAFPMTSDVQAGPPAVPPCDVQVAPPAVPVTGEVQAAPPAVPQVKFVDKIAEVPSQDGATIHADFVAFDVASDGGDADGDEAVRFEAASSDVLLRLERQSMQLEDVCCRNGDLQQQLIRAEQKVAAFTTHHEKQEIVNAETNRKVQFMEDALRELQGRLLPQVPTDPPPKTIIRKRDKKKASDVL